MRLLAKTEAYSAKKRENDALVESNIRLRKYWQGITQKLNTIKEDYEPEKVQRLKDFELFVKDLQVKKSKVLEELAGWQKLVEETKEKYYALVAKQDELDELKYKVEEEHKKLDLREAFVVDLETKWRNKQ